MNWRNLPDAPESVKHWSGRDPSDDYSAPSDYDEALCVRCETPVLNNSNLCFACESDDKAQRQLTYREPHLVGVIEVLNYFNKKFGVKI